MARRIEVRAIKKATFEGDQWEPIFHDETGQLLGFHAMGTNCTVYCYRDYKNHPDTDYFTVPANERVLLHDGLAVVPQAEEAEHD